MDLLVLPLHKYPEYKEQCCELINDEWKRSRTARMRSLDSSCDKLPTNLILLKKNKVIGHCKLSVIPSIKDACFIESVVIDKSLRGNGYGKYLMTKTEEYCRTINLRKIYLSTKDQEIFYNKLGYDICQPISIYGGSSTSNLPTYQYYKNYSITEDNSEGPTPPPMPISMNRCSENHKIFMEKML